MDPTAVTAPEPAAPELTQDLLADVVELTRVICDVESVSGNERRLADAVEAALRRADHLEVLRDGDAVLARTTLGRAERVVLAGHLDTVPLARRSDGSLNVPTRLVGEGDDAVLSGRGTVDMKGGVAVQLYLAATVREPVRDVTYVFYDNEEVDAVRNGLGRLIENHPGWITGDFGVLLEPTDGAVEGGCQGTIRVEVTTRGVAAHAARSWMGRNAIHDAGRVLWRVASYLPREVAVDGLTYREGLNAVGITGGIAGNVVPDRCVVTLNYRFAPDRSPQAAEKHLRELLDGYEVEVVDVAPGARPGLDHPAAAAFVAATGVPVRPKYGWTDVSRLSARGIPAVNFGPGDPLLAHRDDEQCATRQLRECARAMRDWLSPPQPPRDPPRR